MSNAKGLDLSGINLNDIGRQARTSRNFRVAAPSADGKARARPRIAVGGEGGGFPCRNLFVVLIIVGLLYGMSRFFEGGLQNTVKKQLNKGGHLRRMIRMDCQSRNMVSHCTTSYEGDYIVSVETCDAVYEFNGIPFTELEKDDMGNFIVPMAIDNTLNIKDNCKSLVATVDTGSRTEDTFASIHALRQSGSIQKLIWVTDNCYKDFTVKIGDQTIYESTPVTMIKSEKTEKKIAYIYETEVDYLEGSITVLGSGCKSPIVKYVKRSI